MHGVDSEFNITEGLAVLQSLYGTTKGTDTFEKVCDTLRELSLPWEKLASVTTDDAKSMVGHKSGVIGLINSHMDDIGAKRPLAIHYIIHQALCSKSMDVDSVMKVVFSNVNFIRANALNHRQFKSFLDESDAEFKDILYNIYTCGEGGRLLVCYNDSHDLFKMHQIASFFFRGSLHPYPPNRPSKTIIVDC